MTEGGDYKSLVVWQKSITMVKSIYKLTSVFPSDERFGLISQMRRAAVSVPSNIAEGQARRTTGDYIRFVSNAEGSLAELETQLLISIELDYLVRPDVASCFELMSEIRKMLNGLRRSLLARANGSSEPSSLVPRH
jgi:four helix bundle protein